MKLKKTFIILTSVATLAFSAVSLPVLAEEKPYKDVKRSFKTAVRRAKIHDFKFHDTRHTFASHLVMAGVDITTLQYKIHTTNYTRTSPQTTSDPTFKPKIR